MNIMWILLGLLSVLTASTASVVKNVAGPDSRSVYRRIKRQIGPEDPTGGTGGDNQGKQVIGEEDFDPTCDFGDREIDKTLCQWTNFNLTIEKWSSSKGENGGWLGGPPEDHSLKSLEGGYALYETSKLIDSQAQQAIVFDSAMLMSPIMKNTPSIGLCIDFWYSMAGLSQERLRILLRPPPINVPREGNNSREIIYRALTLSDGRDDIVLWENRDATDGVWVQGQVIYAFNDVHMLIFEGIPLSVADPNRAYRGYIALDTIRFPEATTCTPLCNFEGGFCSWSQDTEDDFNWELSRGTLNPSTGPPMDRFSFNYGIKGGGYAFINSGYPRRTLDKARLISIDFGAPGADNPICMRFWTHMFGNGIGGLRVIVLQSGGEDEVIWELKGEQGNNWYQAQVTIASEREFKIIFEADVGQNNLGDIAIDEISLKENACPTSPQSASKFSSDCTFEVDECGWTNVDFREHMDEFDWERVAATSNRAPNKDHTLKSPQGSYITLPRTTVQRGERAWLISSIIPPTELPMCLSFWYFMYDPFIEQSGPSLGALRVIMMEEDEQGLQSIKPLWELKNHQGPNWLYAQTAIKSTRNFMIIFEGLWGNSRGSEYMAIDDITFFMGDCTTKPEKAVANLLDCDFTRTSCYYKNSTGGGIERWLPATISRRPSSLADHTYGGPIGYIYFDVFSTNNQNDPPEVKLMSEVIYQKSGENEAACLTFWYAPIGGDVQTKLIVNTEIVDSSTNDNTGVTRDPTLLWEVKASDLFLDRIEWMFGQVQIERSNDFKITFVGMARKGGFALDDIKVYKGFCKTRPTPKLDDGVGVGG